jgi:hypothetical protein
MKMLLFLSRVTFLYNICMIVTLLMRYQNFIREGAVQSVILVSGIVLSIVFNSLVNSVAVFFLVKKTPPAAFRPQWLFVVNFLCFIFQLYLLLK